MKKTFKRIASVCLCTLLALTALTFTLSSSAANYSYDGSVIYISDNGNDENDGKTAATPVKTFTKAASLGGNAPTIVVTDVLTHKNSISACTLAGLNSDSVLNIGGWCLKLTGDVTVKNLRLNTTQNHSFILASGYTFTAAENVVVSANEGLTTTLGIRGGDDNKVINGDTNVILKSGVWGNVFGGTRNQDVTGNTYITVYDTATAVNVKGGNDSVKDDPHAVLGNSIIKLVGSKVNVKNFPKPTDVKGKLYFDLTEFSGTLTDAAKNLGATVITDKAELEKIKSEGKTLTNEEVKAETKEETKVETTEKKEETPVVIPKAEYTVPENAVYLSNNGDDANDGKSPEKAVKTINKAFTLGGTDPTIAITDEYTITGSLAACTLTGISSSSVLNVNGWALSLTGDVTIQNLTINSLTNWSFVLCKGFTFTSGENVVLTTAENIKPVMSIRGGGEGAKVDGDTNIIIKSGNWNAVFAGSKGADITGNAYLTIYDTAKISSIKAGNDAASGVSGILGNAYIKLVGESAGFNGIIKSTADDVKGTIYYDLTEFTGKTPEAIASQGATVITDKKDIPQFVLDKQKSDVGEYPLPEGTLIYLSDSGDDANDGKTKDKPKKTLNAAQEALGAAGGTVVITGTYTHKGNKKPEGSVSFASTSKSDAFVWSNWSLITNGATFSNIRIIVAKDYAFFLHAGTPLTIGKNVTMENGPGVKYGLGIRAGESGDFALTDITIESGYIRHIFTGTKNGNILGDSKVTILGGKVDTLTIGNDSTEGKTLGNTYVTVKGNPTLGTVADKSQYDGYVIVDFIDHKTRSATSISGAIIPILSPNDRVIPITGNALFINGYPDGTFLPDKVMTRAEAITVLSKLCGLTDKTSVEETTAFTDVTDADWFVRNVKHLEKLGMLGFYGTEIAANTGITRGEFVKLISPLVAKKDTEAPKFSDVPESHKYYNEILLAAKAGLVTGYPDGTFLPENTLKRAEIVTILNRLARRNIVDVNANEIKKFSDVDGHWARNQIIAASSDSKNENGYPVWYAGDKYSENTPLDAKTVESPIVDKVLEGIDVTNADAVMTAVEAYAAKRRAEIRETKTAVEVKGTKYYVAEDGNDANDGKTPETAWKTLTAVNKAALNAGDGVFFKRGDTFRGQLTTKRGVTYSAYGEGAKPNLYGSLRDYANSDFWAKTDKENVYVSKETFYKDVGLIVFNNGEAWSDKQIIGKKDFKGVLDADLELFHDTADFKLYLYSVSDPNTRWSSVEIAEGQHGITGDGNGVTIDNLCVKYVGAHGVGYGDGTTGLTVQNCEFGWIGGMIQRPEDGTRYGNAVEIYVSAIDYTVDNCYIYEVYDAGVTHQYYSTRDAYVTMKNIKYTNNVIEKCTYAIEYINIQPEERGIMKDVVISGNLLLYGGDGFGKQRPDHGEAVIMGGNSINYSENYRIVDNVIHTVNPSCDLVRLGVQRLASVPVVAGNLFVGKEGNRFGIYGLKGTAKQIYDGELVNKNIGLDNNKLVFLK